MLVIRSFYSLSLIEDENNEIGKLGKHALIECLKMSKEPSFDKLFRFEKILNSIFDCLKHYRAIRQTESTLDTCTDIFTILKNCSGSLELREKFFLDDNMNTISQFLCIQNLAKNLDSQEFLIYFSFRKLLDLYKQVVATLRNLAIDTRAIKTFLQNKVFL